MRARDGVYFLSDGRGRIKIGGSWDIDTRVKKLTSLFKCTEGLICVIESSMGGIELETKISYMFGEIFELRDEHPIHQSGWTEWLTDVPLIRAFIDSEPTEKDWMRKAWKAYDTQSLLSETFC